MKRRRFLVQTHFSGPDISEYRISPGFHSPKLSRFLVSFLSNPPGRQLYLNPIVTSTSIRMDHESEDRLQVLVCDTIQ